jgi:hypothetical protein
MANPKVLSQFDNVICSFGDDKADDSHGTHSVIEPGVMVGGDGVGHNTIENRH